MLDAFPDVFPDAFPDTLGLATVPAIDSIFANHQSICLVRLEYLTLSTNDITKVDNFLNPGTNDWIGTTPPEWLETGVDGKGCAEFVGTEELTCTISHANTAYVSFHMVMQPTATTDGNYASLTPGARFQMANSSTVYRCYIDGNQTYHTGEDAGVPQCHQGVRHPVESFGYKDGSKTAIAVTTAIGGGGSTAVILGYSGSLHPMRLAEFVLCSNGASAPSSDAECLSYYSRAQQEYSL